MTGLLAHHTDRVGCVAIENAYSNRSHARQGSAAQARKWGLRAHAEHWAFTHGLSVVAWAPTSVKKALTGSGRADKAAMLAAAEERFGALVSTTKIGRQDEADALGVAVCTLSRLDHAALACGEIVMV
jgi:Holliday junction resolvasome RuvABC endonuclease subunit